MPKAALRTSMETHDIRDEAPPLAPVTYDWQYDSDRVLPSPFLSCVVGRFVNTHADEFDQVADFQSQLGRLNDGYIEDEDGNSRPRFDFEDHHSTMVPAEDLHITHLFAADMGEIILRNFCRDDGRIIKNQEVKKRIFRFTNKYKTTIEQRNKKIQERQLDAHDIAVNGMHRAVHTSEGVADNALAMTNGIFTIEKRLGTSGRGNVFGLVFSDDAQRFLREERAWSLDMAVDKLGVDIDRELEDKILSAPHHVTLIRLGLRVPEWEVTLPVNGAASIPESFVTWFDPKAKPILPHANKCST